MGSKKYSAEEVVAALRASKGMVYVAARQLGCSANTIYNYAKSYTSVQEALTAERGMMIDTAEIALWKAIQNGEGWAISLALKTIGKQRGYVERLELDFDLGTITELVKALRAIGENEQEVFNRLLEAAKERVHTH